MKLEYCADALALYRQHLVVIERLSEPKGLALPGGRRELVEERLEDAMHCAAREFKEETGLVLVIDGTLGVYDAPGRDPRGPKVSTVFYGRAYGNLRNEPDKTKVVLMGLNEIDWYKSGFVFDHYQIIKDWENVCKMGCTD